MGLLRKSSARFCQTSLYEVASVPAIKAKIGTLTLETLSVGKRWSLETLMGLCAVLFLSGVLAAVMKVRKSVLEDTGRVPLGFSDCLYRKRR